MPVEKKYLKLGVAGLAVVALVIGLSVGLTQKNKADDRSAASNVKANNNIASQAGDTCPRYYGGKGGKSGNRHQRRLVVPGAEDADAGREELRGALQRELATDDMAGGGGMSAAGSGSDGGDPGYGRPNRPNGGGKRPVAGGNRPAADDYDYYYYGDYYYGYGKSGKSGYGGKSGGYYDPTCLPLYDPCDPNGTPNPDPCYGKSGKSGSPGCAKSGKSGGYGGKSGGYGGKSGGYYDPCPCDPCYGKSGKSGSPQCGKSGKSGGYGGKSGGYGGKSGNKSGKSGGPGPGTCDCLPTLCPSPTPCVCEDLPFAFINGVCTQQCGVSEDGPYADEGACCLANFPPGAGVCLVDACEETPSPTYLPTAVEPTYSPTVFEQACDCEMLPYDFVGGRCVRGCGLSEDGIYFTMGECCDDNFGAGTGNGFACRQTDECPPDPTPAPTAGSTPTVSTEVTGPPTKPGREGV